MSQANAKATRFMEKLDVWTVETIIHPLLDKGPDAISQVKQAIREQVLQSYRSGCRIGGSENRFSRKGGG